MLSFLALLAAWGVHGSEAPRVVSDGAAEPEAVPVLSPEMVTREKLAFIERSILGILAAGSYPEIFGISTAKMLSCGCDYGTSPVYWGNNVGMYCHLGTNSPSRTCGESCYTPKGSPILLMCPAGWESSCERGCVPPAQFDSEAHRGNFLLQQVELIAAKGQEYITTERRYLEGCGCRDGRMLSIRYGTKVGFECVVEADAGEDCQAFDECTNPDGEPIMIFCPAGFRPTCRGCVNLQPELESLDEKYAWAVNVLTGYVRDTQDVLAVEPSQNMGQECGCATPFKRVEYGNRIGYTCLVYDRDDVGPDCVVSHTVCQNEDLDTVLHFCPAGFKPDCRWGCSYWWPPKDEL